MFLRDGAIYITSRAVPGIIGFLTAMLLTWILSPVAMGVYGFGMAAAALGNSLLFEWVCASFMRWHETHQNDPRFVPTILLLFAGMALLPVPPLVLATLLGIGAPHLGTAWLILLGSVAFGWFEFSARVQIARFSPGHFLVMTLTRNGLMLAGVIGAAYLTDSAEAALLAGFCAAAAAGCLFLGGWASFRPRRYDRTLAREFLAFGAPVGLTRVLSGLVSSGTPILLGVLAGYGAVGAYSVSNTLVQNSLGVFSSGISSALFPAAVRAVESGDPAAAKGVLEQNYILLLSVLAPAALGLALLAPDVASAFVGPALRQEVGQIIPWLCLAAVLLGLRAYHFDYAFQLAKRTGLLVRVVASGAAANLALCLLLVPAYGGAGAAAATACVAAGMLIYGALLVRRVHPMPTPLGETCRILTAALLMAVALCATPLPAGPAGLALSIAGGLVAYAAAYAALDLAGPRRLPRALAGLLRARRAQKAGAPVA